MPNPLSNKQSSIFEKNYKRLHSLCDTKGLDWKKIVSSSNLNQQEEHLMTRFAEGATPRAALQEGDVPSGSLGYVCRRALEKTEATINVAPPA